jgi:hypothetical protein
MQLAQPAIKILHEENLPVLHALKETGHAFPLTAEVDLTMRCQLDCPGCHSKWLHNPSELSIQEIDRIVTQLKANGCRSIVWSGGGEPLESPNWKFAMWAAHHAGMKQGLYSYLPALTQERVNTISHYCEFVYAHNNHRPVQKPDTTCVWTAGFLLDNKNWGRIREFYDKTNWSLFDYCDFRPLIVEGMDYSWVQKAIDTFESLDTFDKLPGLRWARYKFYDLVSPAYGRNYAACHSTHLIAVIGSRGEVWECINRRGITCIGNILDEDLAAIWDRKPKCRTDLSDCRMLCRNHELNKTLYQIYGPAPVHGEFI